MNNLFHFNSLNMIDLTNLFERCYIHLALKLFIIYIWFICTFE